VSSGVIRVTDAIAYDGKWSVYFPVKDSYDIALVQNLVSSYNAYDFMGRIYLPSDAVTSTSNALYYLATAISSSENTYSIDLGIALLVENGKCYLSVNDGISIVDFEVNCNSIVDRWNNLEITVTKTSYGTYIARWSLNGIVYYSMEGYPPAADTVVLGWSGNGVSAYYDLIQFYDLSSTSSYSIRVQGSLWDKAGLTVSHDQARWVNRQIDVHHSLVSECLWHHAEETLANIQG